MQTPFFKVFARQDKIGALENDISEKITRFSYEDAVDVDNLLTLEIRKDGLLQLNDGDLQEGCILKFYWGYLGGSISATYEARLSNIQPSYQDVVSIIYQATDVGMLLKKDHSKKDWKGMTSTQIVRSIADAYGLFAVVDETSKVWDFMPQGSRTYYQFLKYLATLEKDGSFRFFMRGRAIHFNRLALNKESIRTYTYMDGNGEVMKFRPASKEMLKRNSARDTVVTSVDPFTNEVVQKKVNDGNAKDDDKLGQFGTHIFNSDGKQVSTSIGKRPSQVQAAQKDPNRAGEHINTPDSVNAEDIGNAVKKSSALNEYLAELETIGNPNILSDMIITMDGVATRDRGNWYVTRAKHVIDSSSGYKLDISLNKNGTSRQNTDMQNNVNDSIGPQQEESTKKTKVFGFNEDGIQVYEKTSDTK